MQFGTLADRLGNGLQNRVEQFDSARYLNKKTELLYVLSSLCLYPSKKQYVFIGEVIRIHRRSNTYSSAKQYVFIYQAIYITWQSIINILGKVLSIYMAEYHQYT